jgi:hypothetical protein
MGLPSRCCCRVPSLASVVRGLTAFAGLVLFGSAAFTFAATVDFLAALSACASDTCASLRLTSLETSAGAFAIHLFVAAVGLLVVAAECGLSPVALYCGVLALRFGRGVALVTCGLVTASYSRVFVLQLEVGGHAPHGSSVVVTVAGLTAALVGLADVLLSMAPACCGRLSLPADRLSLEMRAIHEAARALKKARAEGGATDPELGECTKSPRARPSQAASGRKGKADGVAAIKAQQATIVVDANPFARPADEQQAPADENPFLKQPTRC